MLTQTRQAHADAFRAEALARIAAATAEAHHRRSPGTTKAGHRDG